MKLNQRSSIEMNKKKNQLFKNINDKSINLDKKEKNKKLSEEKSNIEENSKNFFKIKSGISKSDLFLEKKIEKMVEKQNKEKIAIFKKMSFLDIIKSYFCFKEKKIKLINLCNDFTMKDLCVDRILGRLYDLEKLFSLVSRKKLSKLNLHVNMKFRTILNNINEINQESKEKKNDAPNKNDNILNK